MSDLPINPQPALGTVPPARWWRGRWRSGAWWAGLWLVACCVAGLYAPLVASGLPLMVEAAGGEREFPLVRALSPADWLAMIGVPLFLLGFSIKALRKSALTLFAILALATVGTGLLWPAPMRPPEPVFREREARGEAVVYRTLVPFSPDVQDLSAIRLPPGAPRSAPVATALRALLQPQTLSLAEVQALAERMALLAPTERQATVRTALDAAVRRAMGETTRLPTEGVRRAFRGPLGQAIGTPAAARALDAELNSRRTLTSEERAALGAAVQGSMALTPRERRAVTQAFAAFSARGEVSESECLESLAREASPRAVLGTDASGQDVLAQLIHGARLAMVVGLGSTAIALMLGIALGSMMGWFRGWADALGLRTIEIMASIPARLLLVVVAAVLPKSTLSIVVAFAVLGFPGFAILVRAEFLRLRESDFVACAISGGLSTVAVIVRHMLPSALAGVSVRAAFFVGEAVLAETALSFLGIGPSSPGSWGRLIDGAISGSGEFWGWLAVPAGLCTFLTVLAANALGERLRASMNVRESVR
ncbi:MAG: ABC transporter permease [Phycisphaerales bacterium]